MDETTYESGLTTQVSYSGSTSAFLLELLAFEVIKMSVELSTQQKGIITELQVAICFLQMGYNVSQPLTQDSKYDLIVDVNHRLLRIQVKTSRKNEKTSGYSIKFNCRSTTNNVRECKQRYYSTEDVDYFATYWDGQVYLVPVNQCSAEKILWIDKPQNKNGSYAKNFLAKEVLKRL